MTGDVVTTRPAWVDSTLDGCDNVAADPELNTRPTIMASVEAIRQYLDECDNEGEWPATVESFASDFGTYVRHGGAANLGL